MVNHDDDEAAQQAKVRAAAAARGIDPDTVPLKVFIVRWLGSGETADE